MRPGPLLATAITLAALLTAAAQGCGSDVQTLSSSTSAATSSSSGATAGAGGAGGQAGPTATSTSSTTSAASTSSAGGAGGCGAVAPCQGHVYECGDGLDNDNDGLIDSQDPECTGACDNAEQGLFINIPGFQDPPCGADCFFDQDVGPGNDDCYWSHKCDPNEVPPNYYPEPTAGANCSYDAAANIPGTNKTCAELHNAQSAACHVYCDRLIPNGCDCFGCCELPAGSGKHVWLGSKDNNSQESCDLAHTADPTKCHPCEPTPGCLNPCDACELCLGKSALPPGCSVQLQCAPAEQPCGLPGQACCPVGMYCVTGCCQPTAM